jgi:hypothetical protein
MAVALASALGCAGGQTPDSRGDHERITPLGLTARRVPKLRDLRMDRAEADALRDDLARLPKFPLRLSELEAHLGRPVRRHFNPESFDPTFVHDRGGKGVNIGGTPVHHPGAAPGTPLLLELRSQHYARYDKERKFDRRPPFAADDPIIDLIAISDAYAHGEPPPAPSTTKFEGDYAYIGEQWSIAPLHDGFVSLLTHDRKINPGAERWVFEISTDRGYFHSPAEIEQTEGMLLGFVEAIGRDADIPAMLADLEREHGNEHGILALGLASYNVRFFDADLVEGPHAGEFLRQEGKTRVLYIDVHIQGDARVPLPRFFGALGGQTVTIDPSALMPVAAGYREGGLHFYDNVTIERDGWYAQATGFYPIEAGKAAATTLDLSRFLVRSLTIRHEVRG